MKNILAGILILALLYGVAGHFVVFKSLQLKYRQQAKEVIENTESKEQLVHFTLSTELTQSQSFQWIKEHEFRYQGRMYDIVNNDTINGTRHVYCYHDKKEEKLIAGYTRQIFQNQKKNKTGAQNYLYNILKRLSRQYVENPFIINFGIYAGRVFHLKPFLNLYKSVKITPDTPPPWLFTASYQSFKTTI